MDGKAVANRMTSQSIISTKLNIPFLRAGIVSRPRILEILHEGLERSVSITLISAPAGYGKTTLLASWLRNVDQQVAWLSIEPEDDTYPRFITYLIASLQKVHPSIGVMAGQLLEASQGDSSRLDSIVPSLINDLAGLAQPLILVLEDYHFVQSAAIHDTVRMLMDHMQPQLHCVITTRHDPPLPLARWRARHQLIEIRTHDLQFNLEETTEFLRRVMDLDLPDGDINLLEQRTEGWAAGLQLAALSIRNRKHGCGLWKLEAGHRDIADYLLQETFSQLSTERQEFLLQTSLVSRLSASLCNAITERTDSQSLLEGLDADNLFVIALDDRRKWFRYHHLFAEFLRNRLIAESSVSAVRELHRHASHWLADNGFMNEAIDHALAAEDFEYAACLIGPQSEAWMRRGEASTILNKLSQLPENIVWDDYGLCLWYGWAYALTCGLEPAERWAGRAEILLEPYFQRMSNDETGSLISDFHNAYGQILAIRALIARLNADMTRSVLLSEQALQLIPADNINLRTVVSANLSSATIESGNFEHAKTVTHSARQMAHVAGNPFITYMMLLNESALEMLGGKLHHAQELALEALCLAETESMTQLAFLAQIRLGRIYYSWSQLSQARQFLSAGIEHANVLEYSAHTVSGYLTFAWLQNAEGDHPSALTTLAQAEKITHEYHLPEWLEKVGAARARLQLQAGEMDAVIRWVRSSAWESFDPLNESQPGFNDESFFALCRYLIAMKDPDQWGRIAHLLEWRLQDSERQNRVSIILEIRLMQALLYQAQNNFDLALSALTQALSLAEPEKIIRPFLDSGNLIALLLRRVPHSHPVRGFARQILLSFSNANSEPSHTLIGSLNEQEMTILHLISQGLSNPEIAQQRVLAVSTVRWYVKQIFQKLGVHNRTQAAAQARELGLL